jgi:hypothetical protein
MAALAADIAESDAMNAAEGRRGMIGDRWLER